MFKALASPSPKRGFSPQSLGVTPSAAGRGRHICVVSRGEGVQELIGRLRADKWKITLLDLSPPGASTPKIAGARYQRLAGLYRERNWYLQMQSLTAYHWLRARKFDAILFHAGFAAAFYSCMARHFKLAFLHTPIVIMPDAPHAFTLESEQRLPAGRNDFEADFMEREAMALADGVLFSSRETGLWMHEAGWAIPKSAAYLDKKANAKWGAWLRERTESAKTTKIKAGKPVFISVCIATYNRAEWLKGALESLQKQTHKAFEVIVVDDGSTDKEVEKLRNELKPVFEKCKWRWVRQKNAGPAAARNRAAKLARSEHLLFMDDDNIACPDELERFALAAQQGYDIIACILGLHKESQLAFPPTAQLPERKGKKTRPVGWTPIGGNPVIATFINVLGDTNSLFRREVFEKLGGFSRGDDVVLEDFELLTRALVKGYRIDVIPEVLALYRRSAQSRSMGKDIFAGHVQSLKPIANLLPPEYRSWLLAIRQEWYERHCRRIDGSR